MPASKPYILGLTGGIGCGKSAAAEYLKSLGAAHVDADAISRSLTAVNGCALGAIREHFGDEVFLEDGAIDRAKLAQLIFASTEKRRELEGILHPMIRRIMSEQIDAAAKVGAGVVILDVPLLFETGMDSMCDEVWTMAVPEDVQIERVCERDGMPREAALARIAGQMSMSERNARADRVIDSNGTFDETRKKLNKLYCELTERL